MHLHRIIGEEETAYHDQHLTLRDGRFITKHIYAGQTRIASKMDPDWFRDPPTIYHQPDHLGPVPFVTPTPASLRAGHLRDPIRVQFPRICVAAYSRAPGSGPI